MSVIQEIKLARAKCLDQADVERMNRILSAVEAQTNALILIHKVVCEMLSLSECEKIAALAEGALIEAGIVP